MSAPTITKAEPVHGTARWVGLPFLAQRPLVEINGKVYELQANPNRTAGSAPLVLRSLDGATYYLSVKPGLEQCSCPDFRHRARECKHIRGVRALLDNPPVEF